MKFFIFFGFCWKYHEIISFFFGTDAFSLMLQSGYYSSKSPSPIITNIYGYSPKSKKSFKSFRRKNDQKIGFNFSHMLNISKKNSNTSLKKYLVPI